MSVILLDAKMLHKVAMSVNSAIMYCVYMTQQVQ